MKSLFIIGCPRSGTTYLLRLLASNQKFGWVSNHLNNDPENYKVSEDLSKYGNTWLTYKKYNRLSSNGTGPLPVEAWNFWNTHFDYFQWNKKFCELPRNAFPNDNSDNSIIKVRNAVNQILDYSNRDYFLSKYTDFPRIQLIKRAFPDAKFVHIVRDGRAVANSYRNKVVSGNFNTAKEETNWVGSWPKEWQYIYSKMGKNPYAFTLFQWKFFVKEIQKELKTINSKDFLEINYSDLVCNTTLIAKEILDFAGVDMDKSMNYFIKNMPGENKNKKWKESIQREEKDMIDEILFEDEFKQLLDRN